MRMYVKVYFSILFFDLCVFFIHILRTSIYLFIFVNLIICDAACVSFDRQQKQELHGETQGLPKDIFETLINPKSFTQVCCACVCV